MADIELENEYLSVQNIKNGRLAMHINEHIKEVMEDILDPNKPAKSRREITVKIGFAPSKSRRDADIDFVVQTKLAAMEKETSSCNVRRVGGKAFASNEHIEQQELEFSAGQEN